MNKKNYLAPVTECTETLTEALLCISDVTGSGMEGFTYDDSNIGFFN